MSNLLPVLQVVSNLTYLGPITYVTKRRLYMMTTIYTIVMVSSIVYHVCTDFLPCNSDTIATTRILDHFMANWGVGITVIFIFYVDLIERRYASGSVPTAHRRKRPGTRILYHAHVARTHNDHYVLAPHALHQPVVVGNIFFTLGSVLFLLDTPYEYAVTSSYLAVVSLLALALYWRVKRRTFRKRFCLPYVGLGILLLASACVVFFYETPGTRGLHALWHVLSALGLLALIAGSAQHLKEFRA